MRNAPTLALAFVLTAETPPVARAEAPRREVAIDVRSFRVVERKSGPVNYYSLANGPEPYWHAAYKPPMATAVLGYSIPEKDRRSILRLKWKWRAVVLPKGGDECTDGKGDSAAVVYVTFKRGMRWYTLKYVWSAVGTKGSTCHRTRNPFVAQDTIIVESGLPLNEWRTVEIDPDKEFRMHFEDGDPKAAVPDLVGIGIMTDGDQTASPSEADYAGFTLALASA
jgi:hypothetical protein